MAKRMRDALTGSTAERATGLPSGAATLPQMVLALTRMELRLALRRGVYSRGFVYEFITLFAPQYDRRAVDAALAAETANAT